MTSFPRSMLLAFTFSRTSIWQDLGDSSPKSVLNYPVGLTGSHSTAIFSYFPTPVPPKGTFWKRGCSFSSKWEAATGLPVLALRVSTSPFLIYGKKLARLIQQSPRHVWGFQSMISLTHPHQKCWSRKMGLSASKWWKDLSRSSTFNISLFLCLLVKGNVCLCLDREVQNHHRLMIGGSAHAKTINHTCECVHIAEPWQDFYSFPCSKTFLRSLASPLS